MSLATSKEYPASLIQEQFWLINKLQPDNTAYNIPSLFRLKGSLNIDALTRSLSEIVRRHDIFRTTFSIVDNRLQQIIAKDARLSWATVKINEQEHENVIHHLLNQEVSRPFDLAHGPLLRGTLLRLSEHEHILLIMMHHIITDLRSKKLFATELSALYSAYAANTPSSLTAPPTHQYKDFALWQRSWLEGEKCSAMVSYWQRTLQGCSGYLNLPTDQPRSPVPGIAGKALPLRLPQPFISTLKEFSREHNVNIFLALLTAYYILLFRYTNQNDIVAGVPLTNRREDAHKNIPGCFVNILPIAIHISGKQNFEEILQQVRRAMLGAHRNQEVPYDLLVKKLPFKRDASYNPLFQTGFTFEPPMELQLSGLEVKAQKIHSQGAQLDLFFTLWEKEEEIHGFVEFNGELFEETTIQRIMGNYETLLQEIIVNPQGSINSLNILTEQEKREQLCQWNETATALPAEPLLHKLFEEQADRTPEAVAVIFENSQLTYRELNSRANQLAHYLRALAVGPGTFIGVFMDRSLEMVVALYAVLKAGGAYVPLDPAFPRDRISFMLADTNIHLLLTEKKVAHLLHDHDAHKVLLDEDWPAIGDEPTSNPAVKLAPEKNLAYLIYTSGSTGKPKGVQVPHKAVVNFLISMSREPGITDQDVLLAVTTLSFDISVLELFLPLTVGGKIVIASQEISSNGEQLRDLLRSAKATVMQATPTTWHILMAAGWEGSSAFKVLCGGEPLPREMALKLTQRSASVWNLYGPTETTIWSTCCKISDTDRQILIGRPIANTQIYIVNQSEQPNPVGVAGEMLIGGTGVTCGYLNRPDLTREKFIPNTFTADATQKLYRTGDMACFLQNGSIKILGRLDNQVKLRGFRIELGEIETILEAHPAIQQAAAIVREDEPGDKRLVAYVTLVAEHEFAKIKFRPYLRAKLPEYMIPSIFVEIQTMPLTLNGKIDRRALPRPEQKRPSLEQEFTPPKNETEIILSRLWSQILKIDTVGTQDNFFDAGGDSLLSVQLVALIEKEINIDIPIVKFFQYPTIHAFGEYIDSKRHHQQPSDAKSQSRAQLQKKALALRQLQARRKLSKNNPPPIPRKDK